MNSDARAALCFKTRWFATQYMCKITNLIFPTPRPTRQSPPSIVPLALTSRECGSTKKHGVTSQGRRRLVILGSDSPSPLPWREHVRILCDAVSALCYLHALDPPVLHRDVKPSNILLERDGKARLADPGLAKAATESPQTQFHVTTAHVSMPTPGPARLVRRSLRNAAVV